MITKSCRDENRSCHDGFRSRAQWARFTVFATSNENHLGSQWIIQSTSFAPAFLCCSKSAFQHQSVVGINVKIRRVKVSQSKSNLIKVKFRKIYAHPLLRASPSSASHPRPSPARSNRIKPVHLVSPVPQSSRLRVAAASRRQYGGGSPQLHVTYLSRRPVAP